MIDTILNMLFRCSHRRLTRPVSPVAKAGQRTETYVVCLDCGKQFAYDVKEMRIGKPLERSHDRGVLSPDLPPRSNGKMKLALCVSVPAALLLGIALKGGKPREGQPAPPEHEKEKRPL